MRRIFVMAQVALSFALLASAGLFLRSLQRAAHMDPGFDGRGAHMISFDLSMEGYDEIRGRAFKQQLLERARRLPGVRAVADADELPLDLGINETPVTPEGWQAGSADGRRSFSTAFAAVGRAGRDRRRRGREEPDAHGVAGTDAVHAGNAALPRGATATRARQRRSHGGSDPRRDWRSHPRRSTSLLQ